ncbi:10634_t:CDS:10 [Acaulospora colombiana]|uniref:10634_t:CDS:1 n=1 Tax=Acaulospora colombiana TaxID=27376 RepID=A0ACA9JVQ3_9GLOM|nr:10634_t:CDS:10 [Acaulospora colombiana]
MGNQVRNTDTWKFVFSPDFSTFSRGRSMSSKTQKTPSTPSNSAQPTASFAQALNATVPITLTLPRKGRAKNLLRNYYGLGPDGKKADPLDIVPCSASESPIIQILDVDNSAFEADQYFNSLLAERHLYELMQRDNDLSTEIRQLDGDMKTLVYENYNKFISATDTIRKMKSNVESMESEMEQLSKSMANISDVTTSVNTALGSGREKIRQLTGVHDLLKKIQFIFELPTRLKLCLDQKSYAQAVRYYAKTSKLLEHYRSLSVFNSIEMECKEIMDKVTRSIKENMTKEDASGSEITDCVGLLITLKEPPEVLAKEYLDLQSNFFAKLLVATIDKMSEFRQEQRAEENDLNDQPVEMHPQNLSKQKLVYLNETFLKEFSRFVDAFNSFFLLPPRDIKDSKSPGKSPARSPRNHDMLKYACANVDEKVKEVVRKDFIEFYDATISEYLKIIDGLLEFPMTLFQDDISVFHPENHLQLLNELYFAVLSCHSLCSIGKLDERVKGIIEVWKINIGRKLFGNAEELLIVIVTLVMSRMLLDFGEIFVAQVYTSYSDRLYPRRDGNNNILVSGIYGGYDEKHIVAKEMAQDVREVVGLCKDRTLERYVEIVGNKLSKSIRVLYSSNRSELQNSNEVDDKVSTASQPSKVSEIWVNIISELTYIEKEAVMLYGPHDEEDENVNENLGKFVIALLIRPDNAQSTHLDPSSVVRSTGEASSGNNAFLKPPYSHSNSSYSSVNSGQVKASPNPFASQVNLMSHIDKLFSDRIEVYGVVEFSKFGIIMGVVKILLKTWIETIRMHTLTNQVFQQIQIDSEYMRVKLWKFVEDER